MMKNIQLFTFGLIALLLFGSALILAQNESPEDLIIGKWKEVSWNFERIDVDTTNLKNDILEYQKKELYSNLLMHNAEEWEFNSEKNLTLRKSDNDAYSKELKWYLKGRGNILELKYGDQKIESYQVHKLTKDSLVIYYHFDLQMRGSVKITFKKAEQLNYAQKI